MLRRVIKWRIDASAKELSASMDYIKEILRTSLPAFRRFILIFPISNYRGKLPADAYHTARIVASRDEDCGTCVQAEVNLAIKAGVGRDVLQAIIESNPHSLPVPLGALYCFVEAVVQSTGEDIELRPIIVEHYGRVGLVEIALAIGASRFLPICKRTLGHATQCSVVRIEF
jgi:alkylhydroperoxidase family enzyme